MTRVCDVCGSEFSNPYPQAKRCSDRCRRKADCCRARKNSSKRAASVADGVSLCDVHLCDVVRVEVDGRVYERDWRGKAHLMGKRSGVWVRQALIDALEARR